MTIKSLAGLATVLPPKQIEWNRGRLETTADPKEAPENGLTAIETVLGIGTCESWLAFRHIGVAKEFASLVDAVAQELAPELRSRGIKMVQPRCDLYLSSPHAVTPCHIDHQNSFLLQVQGTKRVWVFDSEDREILPQPLLELLTAKRRRSFKMNRRFMDRAQAQALAPGAGLFLPARTPHFVRNGDQASISLSLTFGTEALNRERAALSMNYRLRRIGLTPRALGTKSSSDAVKAALLRRLGGTRRILRQR